MTEEKATYSKANKETATKVAKATKIVDAILLELSTRKGFDDLFTLIDDEVMAELKETLNDIIVEVL